MAQNSITLNHVNLDHINTDLNQANSNDANLDQLIPVDSTTINDSAEMHALNQLFSWDRDSTDASSNTVSNITQLSYLPSIHTDHTPISVYYWKFYPLVLYRQIYTYRKIEPPSRSHESSAKTVTP